MVEDILYVDEERIVALRGNTASIRRCPIGIRMNLCQRKVLKHDPGLRKIMQQLFDDRLPVLAVRALQIGELYQQQVLALRSTSGPICLLLKEPSPLRKWHYAEVKDGIRNCVLPVRGHKELCRLHLTSLRFIRHIHQYLRHTCGRCFLNPLHSPDAVRIIAPDRSKKSIHRLETRRRSVEKPLVYGRKWICIRSRSSRCRAFGACVSAETAPKVVKTAANERYCRIFIMSSLEIENLNFNLYRNRESATHPK